MPLSVTPGLKHQFPPPFPVGDEGVTINVSGVMTMLALHVKGAIVGTVDVQGLWQEAGEEGEEESSVGFVTGLLGPNTMHVPRIIREPRPKKKLCYVVGEISSLGQ